MRPSSDLGNGLTEKIILEMLNSGQSYFDFEYEPKESDCLKITNGLEHPRYEYMSLIHKNGEWQKGSNPAFSSSIETIAKGRFLRSKEDSNATKKWLVSQRQLSEKELFQYLLSAKSHLEQEEYMTALIKRFPGQTYQNAQRLGTSNDPKDRILGIRIMTELSKSNYHVKLIRSYLHHKLASETDQEILETLIFSLTSDQPAFSDEDAKRLISVKDKGPRLKIVLMEELIAFDNEIILDFFVELGRDINWGVKKQAIKHISCAIDENTPKIRALLWENVGNEDKNIHQNAIYGLACRKDNKIKPVLVTALENSLHCDPIIIEACEVLGDLNMIPLLESHLNKAGTNRKCHRLLTNAIQAIQMNAQR
jgi:hypothetical protein